MPTALAEPPLPGNPAPSLEWPPKGHEFVGGEWFARHKGMRAALVGGNVLMELHGYLDANPFAVPLGAGMHYRCFPHEPDRVRLASATVVAKARIPKDDIGAFRFPPMLAAEVVSKGDEADDIEGRIDDFLRAGTSVVWAVFINTRTVMAYSGDTARRFGPDDTIDAEPVLPGFRVRVAKLFEE